MRKVPALLLALIVLALTVPTAASAGTPDTFRRWGLDDVRHIDRTFWLPARGLYADEATPGLPPSPDKPAFMWGCGVELSALVAASRLDPHTYVPEMRRFIAGMGDYWVVDAHGLGGYEVLPRPNPIDRYYDDNVWVALDLADAYGLTHDPQILRQAQDTFRFVMSGEDDTLGGGIYWHEAQKNSKNTCSNAPVIVAALRLYQITHDPADLATARRLYAWVNAHLQDTDGLYFDNIGLDGTVHKDKWSYNSALMIRANALFYHVTHQRAYLLEAQRIARAAEARWVDPQTGAFTDGAAFAHLLSESFLFLYDQDHDPHHLAVVRNALVYVHDHVRDANGDYGGHWDRTRRPQNTVKLIDEASAARAFLMAAPYLDHADAPAPVTGGK